MFTTGVTALWTLSKVSHGSSLPISAFALTGYSSVLLWRNMPSRLGGAVEANFTLMYHRQVKIIDVYASRIALEFMGASASFIVLAVLYTAFGWMSLPVDILKVVEGWFMLTWFGAALAILIGALGGTFRGCRKAVASSELSSVSAVRGWVYGRLAADDRSTFCTISTDGAWGRAFARWLVWQCSNDTLRY